MDKSTLENIFAALRKLREAQEMAVQITRVNTQINILNGPVSSSLVAEGIDPNMLSWVLQVIGPVISFLASEDESGIDNALQVSVAQINQQFHLNIPKDWLRSEVEPLVTDKLKIAHLHRSSSMGNILVGVAANKLYRENKHTHEKYPFVQLRFDYVDNNAPQPIPQSFMMDMYEHELVNVRDALDQIIDTLNKDED